MSGVIDEYGQWERCNCCGRYVLIQTLCYEKPSEKYRHGRDLCRDCNYDPLKPTKELLKAFADSYRETGSYEEMREVLINYSATERNDADGEGPINGTENKDYTDEEVSAFIDKHREEVERLAGE